MTGVEGLELEVRGLPDKGGGWYVDQRWAYRPSGKRVWDGRSEAALLAGDSAETVDE